MSHLCSMPVGLMGDSMESPIGLLLSFLAYRTDLLEEAGLDVPESWEDVLEVAKHS